jgi:3-oxoadipate enol-lactonase
MATFLSRVCSLDWDACRALLEKRIPGSVSQAVQDAANVFGCLLPALGTWEFGPQQAAEISQPVMSVVGTDSEQLFVDGHQLLHSWFPQVEDCTIEDVAHLLHVQRPEPVARGIASFLSRHPIEPAIHAVAHAGRTGGD